jgi:hypothetical protein
MLGTRIKEKNGYNEVARQLGATKSVQDRGNRREEVTTVMKHVANADTTHHDYQEATNWKKG